MTIPQPTLLKEKCIVDEDHQYSDNGWTVAKYEGIQGDSMIIRLPWGQKESFQAYTNSSERDYIAQLCETYEYDIEDHEDLVGEYLWVAIKSLSVTGDTLKAVTSLRPMIPHWTDKYDEEEIFESGHTRPTQEELEDDETIDSGMNIEDVEKLYDARYYLEEADKYPNHEGWVEGEINGFRTDGDVLEMRVWTPFGEKTYHFDIHDNEIEQITDMYDTNISEFQTLTGRPIRIMVEDMYFEDGEVQINSWIMANSGDISNDNDREINAGRRRTPFFMQNDFSIPTLSKEDIIVALSVAFMLIFVTLMVIL